MSTPGALRRPCVRAWVLLALAGAWAGACAKPERIQMGQVMRMGQFVLRADDVEVSSRPYGDVLDVKVTFTVGGGNRFDRLEFTETVSRKGRVYITAAGGWKTPSWLSSGPGDVRNAFVFAYPPRGSHGYTLEIGNPYGEPKRFIVDLGR